MSDSKGVNCNYKDRMFTFIFGNSENKEWTLSLDNAINGSDYTNPYDIKLNTIDNVVYMVMKNGVSFLIVDMMNGNTAQLQKRKKSDIIEIWKDK
ncbi:MAG: hypothetical protein K2J08_08315 [Ruminococcus sp.]|nr:hypothetical protein [Ruminococcus sp.]